MNANASQLDELGDLPADKRADRLRKLLVADEQVRMGALLLGVACAERAWRYWADEFPDDDGPLRFLRYLAGDPRHVDRSVEVLSRLRRLHGRLDELLSADDPPTRAIAAGFAVWAAARDLVADGGSSSIAVSEHETDPYDWSPCFYASATEAAGAVWEEGSDPGARRAFWTWYIGDAAVAAAAKTMATAETQISASVIGDPSRRETI
jgi:hypothetical protein